MLMSLKSLGESTWALLLVDQGEYIVAGRNQLIVDLGSELLHRDLVWPARLGRVHTRLNPGSKDSSITENAAMLSSSDLVNFGDTVAALFTLHVSTGLGSSKFLADVLDCDLTFLPFFKSLFDGRDFACIRGRFFNLDFEGNGNWSFKGVPSLS